MANGASLLNDVRDGPRGPQVAAYFDFDRTLISGFSAGAFVREWITSGRADIPEIAEAAAAAMEFQTGRIGFSSFLTRSMVMLRGLEESAFEQIGRDVAETSLKTEIYPEMRELVSAHREMGHRIAIVSSAMRYQIEATANELGIDDVLCTDVEVVDGKFTGEVLRPTCYGEGKAIFGQRYAATHGLDLIESYFYTDSDEDLPLLEIVGRPRPVNPNRRLASIAAKRRWPTASFDSRGTPRAVDVMRTSLALWSAVPSFFMGLPAALLDGSLREAVNLTASTWGEVGTALAGVNVRIDGEEHLWSDRPAVFIFNHQSALDALLVCKLLRRDFVGIGKKEIQSYPILGQLFAMAGTIFIDRMNSAEAVRALQPAVDALREGISITIAPEGTRSVTARLGRFKKGAFRMAMNAGRPIVPIVFHNALDALPKHALVVRPTTVDVTVLPPIHTTEWTDENLGEHIAGIEALYRETLADSEPDHTAVRTPPDSR